MEMETSVRKFSPFFILLINEEGLTAPFDVLLQAIFMICFLFFLCADGQQSSSSLDVSPQGDEYRCFSQEELTDSDSLSDDGNCRGTAGTRGIVNPNYPGFQHLADQLQQSDTDDTEEERYTRSNNNYNNNNNNNNEDEDNNGSENVIESKIDSVNHLDSVDNFQKAFYDKPKFNIPVDSELDCYSVGGSDSIVIPDDEKDLNVHLPASDIIVTEESEKIVINTEEAESGAESDSEVLVTNMAAIAVSSNNIGKSRAVESQQITYSKMSDAFLSGAKEDLLGKGSADGGSTRSKCQEAMSTLQAVGRCVRNCNGLNMEEDSNRVLEEWEDEEKAVEKFSKEEQTASEKEKDEDSVVPRKKEKMEINYNVKKNRSNSCTSKMELQQASSVPGLQQQEEHGGAVVRRRDCGPRSGRDHMLANRRSVPTAARDKKPSSTEILGTYCRHVPW
jgi:hypothetical protein